MMNLALLCLLALPVQEPRAQDAKAAALEPAFLEALREDHPSRRRSLLAALRRTHRMSFAEWEAFVASLPRPALPLATKDDAGTLLDARADLWVGAKGKLTTHLRYYLPRSFDPARRYPLLVTNHGSGVDAHAEIAQWIQVAEQIPMILIGADEQKENTGYRASEHERMTPLAVLRWAKLHLPIDFDRIFLAGTSRGGHIAWDVATRFPDPWAGVIVLIGGPRLVTNRGENNLRLVRNLLETPLYDLQGEKDDPGLLFNVRLAFERLRDAPHAKLITWPDLGHSYRLDAVDWKAFFTSNARRALPSSIRFWCVNVDQGRRSWLRVTRLDRRVKDVFRPKVEAKVWNKLDNAGRKSWVAEEAERLTASLEANLARDADETRVVFNKADGIREVRLLLPRALWPEGSKRLAAQIAGKDRRLQPRADLEAFLLDYAEHLDRTTAPVVVATVRF